MSRRLLPCFLLLSCFASSLHASCEAYLHVSDRVTIEFRDALAAARPSQRLLVELYVSASVAESREFQRELSQAGLVVVEKAVGEGSIRRIEVAGSSGSFKILMNEGTPLRRKIVLASLDQGEVNFGLAADSLKMELDAMLLREAPGTKYELSPGTGPESALVITIEKNPEIAAAVKEKFRYMPLEVLQRAVSYHLDPVVAEKLSPGLRAAVENASFAELSARIRISDVAAAKRAAGQGLVKAEFTSAAGGYEIIRATGSPRQLSQFLGEPFVVEATLGSEPWFGVSLLRAKGTVRISLDLSEAGRDTVRKFLSSHEGEARLVYNGRWYEGSDFIEYYPLVSKIDVWIELPASRLQELVSSLDSYSHVSLPIPFGKEPPGKYSYGAYERDDSGAI